MKHTLHILFLLVFLVGCQTTYQTQTFQQINIPTAPNYEDEKAWAVLPSKYPEELKPFTTNVVKDLKADVFYVYPTLLMDTKDLRWNAPIDDLEQHTKIVTLTVKYQASPFATSGKIYVPIYRQAHIRSYSLYKKGGKQAFEIAYADVKKAFETYLKKYNNGRPIIIASHSQGTNHTTQLLKDFFDEKPLQQQLIAAYIPGMGIKPDEFETLKPMVSPSETGGFVSWNTRKRNSYPKKKDVFKGSVTTNPITWDSTLKTTRDQHKGFLYSDDKLYKNSFTAQITDGMVWISLPHFPLRYFAIFKKNYHIGDINLFWQDIKENVELRTKTWLKKNQ
ncbi:MAG: DUF3089 domain-containing protein [Polaribacter sp.]|nr:DUF3089 domain-containing protein [Polaribacter sp.]